MNVKPESPEADFPELQNLKMCFFPQGPLEEVLRFMDESCRDPRIKGPKRGFGAKNIRYTDFKVERCKSTNT